MENSVRARRDELGFTQKDVAKAVGVTRQSLNAIETARAVPNVALALRLARVLGCDVETLFGGELREELEADLGAPVRSGTRVVMGSVRGRWVAYPLVSELFAPSHYAADGFVRGVSGGRARLELARRTKELEDTILLGGCAPAMHVLTDRLDPAHGPGRFRWLMQASNVALRALAAGHLHVAGVHLPENAPKQLARLASRHLPTERGALYAFAKWDAGLVVPAGNPGRVRDMRAFEQPKLRVAMREPGSGARIQFARLLRTAGLDIAPLVPRSVATHSHMTVAQAVQLGAADVGFAIRPAALAFDLTFVPLVEERFDLVIPGDLASDPRVRRLLAVLASSSFRRELDELGYDARGAGQKVADLAAL